MKTTEAKPKIKQSETITVKRSLIQFAAYNPRKKDPKVIEALKRNFKKVGFLGGIVWNKTTGNLVGGHKRLETLDLIYNYTGENDYEVKVEMVELDLKTEKEQNIFLNNKRVQGEMDYEQIAKMLPELDLEATGLNEIDLNFIETLVPNFEYGETDELKEKMQDAKPMSKEQVKQQKANSKKESTGVQQQTHFTVTFETYEEKAEYLESLGINGDSTLLTSKQFFKAIQE